MAVQRTGAGAIVEGLVRRLTDFELRRTYTREQPPNSASPPGGDLLTHVMEVLEPTGHELARGSAIADAAYAFGGGFWPDIIVRQGNQPIAAIELKLVKPHPQDRPKVGTQQIATTIGQCVIYRSVFPAVIGFVAQMGSIYPDQDKSTAVVGRCLRDLGIHLIVRRPE